MRRDFSSRQDLEEYLRASFPNAAQRDGSLSPIRGGRRASEERLAAFDAQRYAATRNSIDGSVSRLSPYIRHGVLVPGEMREAVLRRFGGPRRMQKFLQELAWHDYFNRIYRGIGSKVWQDREEYKTGFHQQDYDKVLPPEIPAGETGLQCMDSFAGELRASGYLHNHARLWIAAYVVHWRKIRWQAGARWFLTHLLDGDPASNNLSWQWVASTFSAKPYIFNRESLDRYSGERYCGKCLARQQCPFEGTYAELTAKLFPLADFPEASE